jgi:hypothetical protein
MDLAKTKQRIKELIDDNDNEGLLIEVRKILELSSNAVYELSEEEKNELNEAKERYEKGELKSHSWPDLRLELLERLRK